jgi:L-alanine-DL-glutamate epimerase-like enolase superfamily enzyme
VVLRLTSDEGLQGFGEACPVQAFSGETQEAVVRLLEGPVREVLLHADPLQHVPLIRQLEPRLVGCPFTLAAADMALYDLAGKALGVSAAALLGGTFRDRIEMHGSIGWAPAEAMADQALEQLSLGYRCMKLYVGRDQVAADLHRVQAVRDAVGAQIGLVVDVNGLWDLPTCRRALPVMRDLGVSLLEQPLPAWDEEGLRRVCEAGQIDVAGDEAICTDFDVARAGRRRTMDAVNLGVSKMGGLLRARDGAAVARSTGLRVVMGSVLELDIATAAGLQFAASVPVLPYPSYLIGPIKYERRIAAGTFQVRDGAVAVPGGPGLGVEVDADALAALDLRG